MIARLLTALVALCFLACGASASCVHLTVANGGIGSSPPSAGGGATRPSVSNWGPPTNPGQQGSSGLGLNDDAVAIWSTIPYQTCNGTTCTISIDADAIGGIAAGGIKFAVNGGTYVAATAYPDSSPIGATGAACAFFNVSDVPAGQLEARAEICPILGWCRELSSVQTATVPSGSEVVTLPAHGQIPLKVIAITSPVGDTTDFAAYSATSAGTTETYHNLYCIVGTVTPNTFLLAKVASASRSDNGTSPFAGVTCAPSIVGYIDNTNLIVTTADSKGTSLANASPLNFTTGSGGYVCQITVTTICPFVTTDTSGVGAIGVYPLSANSGTSGLNWTGTATISGTTLTIVTTTSGSIAAGQTLGESGGGSIVTIASGSGSTWTLSAAPGNVGSATAMSTGTPVEMWAAQIAEASSNTSFTMTYWQTGPHEQFPTVNQEKNHNNGSLFLYVDKSPINDYTVYANSVALIGGTGATPNDPVNSIDAAAGAVKPTNNGVAQTIGNNGTCSTFTKSGNTGSGNAFFQVNDPIYMDVGVGSVISTGLYYVVSAATNVLTLSASPGGACLNDATLTSGSAWLYRDFSTTTINLQCYVTFGVQCGWTGTATISGTTFTVVSTTSGAVAIGQTLGGFNGNSQIVSGSGSSWVLSAPGNVPSATPMTTVLQADYAFNTASEGNIATRGSYGKIQPDPGGGGDLAVPQWDTALSTDGGSNMKIENVKYTGAIIYPSMTTHLVRPVPAGVSNPTITIQTSSIGSFNLTTSSAILANDCVPTGYYGTTVPGATAGGGASIVSIVNNGDGTTSITFNGTGGYAALATTSYCAVGDGMMFENPWHLHNGATAAGSMWLDQVKMYGTSQRGMSISDSLTGPFGTGQFYKLFVTNSETQYMASGFSYASMIENSYGYAIYTKCAETDVIVINSSPCDDMSNTYRARFMPVTGPPSPYWEPTIGSSNVTNTITMSPANMALNLSWLWAVQYQCGATVATTSLQSFSYVTGVLSVSPALNSACSSTPVSQVHMIDGSHEDCNQYDLPDRYINTNFYDGFNGTSACFGVQTLLPGSNSMMMDTVFLNSNLLFGIVNPEIQPGYYDLQLQMPTSNLYVHNSELSYMSQVNGSFSTPGPGDVVWNNSPCPATPGFMSALVGGSYPFLSVINNPATGGC